MTIEEVSHEIDLYLEQLAIEGNQGRLAWNILMELKEKIQKKGSEPYNKAIELVEKVDKWSCAMPDSEFDKGYKTACSLIKYNLNILKEETNE